MTEKLNQLRPSTSRINLVNSCHLRSAIVISLSTALWAAHDLLNIDINLTAALSPLALLAALNLFYYWQLYTSRPHHHRVLTAQLILDISLLSVTFYFSGGPSNPFISFYLVPLTISATLLAPSFTWLATGITFAAYTGLLLYAPQPTQMAMHHQHGASSSFNIHLIGMWINFALSAMLIAYFIIRLNIEIANRDKAISNYREKLTHREQVLGLATLATGAAHEISTPLSTIAVTIGDLLHEPSCESVKDDLLVVKGQVNECKAILSQLTAEAGQDRFDYQRPARDISNYINHLINRLKIMRPQCPAYLIKPNISEPTLVSPAPTIDQAIINLINNACDASPQNVQIQYFIKHTELIVEISDQGEGIDSSVLEHIGKPYISSGKENGLGLGLFLANSTFDQFGGSLSLHNQVNGGTLTRVVLPLSAITPREHQDITTDRVI